MLRIIVDSVWNMSKIESKSGCLGDLVLMHSNNRFCCLQWTVVVLVPVVGAPRVVGNGWQPSWEKWVRSTGKAGQGKVKEWLGQAILLVGYLAKFYWWYSNIVKTITGKQVHIADFNWDGIKFYNESVETCWVAPNHIALQITGN